MSVVREVDWTRKELARIGEAVLRDLAAEAEETGSVSCPCVYCSYWARPEKCSFKRTQALLQAKNVEVGMSPPGKGTSDE